ncbi:MAG: hypothetical protein QM785_00275 [Pyrinomonadaceae bacterium]
MRKVLFLSVIILYSAVLISGQLLPGKPTKQTKPIAAKPKPTPTPTAKPGSSKVIKEGIGIDGVTVGKSTSKDVIKKFGKVYRWEVNKKYSYQMTYPDAGVSFYFCQNDKREEIFLIELKSPYKGKTSRGITLGKSTKEETEKIYGKPKDGFEYPGINFYYNRYGNRNVITEIDILEKSGMRQCDAKK